METSTYEPDEELTHGPTEDFFGLPERVHQFTDPYSNFDDENIINDYDDLDLDASLTRLPKYFLQIHAPSRVAFAGILAKADRMDDLEEDDFRKMYCMQLYLTILKSMEDLNGEKYVDSFLDSARENVYLEKIRDPLIFKLQMREHVVKILQFEQEKEFTELSWSQVLTKGFQNSAWLVGALMVAILAAYWYFCVFRR